ncbi:hypothetical protein, partial [Acidovorax lacteus]|uniref:hypothetical protein n=1 Tax=Acidovorax lacteus TaxID=1924988 RepID=UPI0031F1BC1E
PGPGGVGGLRKVAGYVGRNYVVGITDLGGASSSVTLSAGVRTRLFSATGRGALRSCGLFTDSNRNMRAEVVIDGVLAIDTGTVSVPATRFFAPVGYWPSGASFYLWDWVPFDASVEVFFTASTAMTNSFVCIADIHQ